MMPLLPPSLLVVSLALLPSGALGYGSPARQRQRRGPGRPNDGKLVAAAASFSNARSAGPATASSRGRAILNAGLRDLVGPYGDGDDYYGDGAYGDSPSNSVRDERNDFFDNGERRSGGDRAANFGSGGYGSGGSGGGGGSGRRNSPGFVGFDRNRDYRDGNYPDYDVAIGRPPAGGGGQGARRGGSGGARIFDNVDFDDLPGSATRRIGSYGPYADPYGRGSNSDFVNTNGSSRARNARGNRSTLDVGSRSVDDFDDFDRVPGAPPIGLLSDSRSPGRRQQRGGPAPQVYRRDYSDVTRDGRPFESLTAVEQYFEAWNRRDIPLALSCFDDQVYYDDTQFSEPFDGKDKLADHLLYVADCLPDSFYFVVDELSVGSAAPSRRRDRAATPTFQLGRSRVPRMAGGRSDGGPPTASIGALWHVENEFGPLPFARGCSFFKVDPGTNLIVEAYDFPEPAILKTGSTGLRILSAASKLARDPKRWVPFAAWVAYVYLVYFSNGILPGKDILHADAKTWSEVQDLSFNFMFVAPVTRLPTAAKVSPVLEGLFNGLLAWAFMFAGFLSDERSGTGPYGSRDPRYYERMVENQEQVLDNGVVLVPPVSIAKKNLIGLVPTIIGMQFLMSAFFLPYLFTRTSERTPERYSDDGRGGRGRRGPIGPRRIRPLYKEELDRPALVLGEWRGLGVLLGAIGVFALYWGFAGRPETFGPPIWVSDKRAVEFMKLLDKDRVAAGFVVDLWVFGIFQGWLVDDDWKRRGRSLDEEKFLRNVAKFVPFFGLASYLVFRPRYPSLKDGFDDESFLRGDPKRRGGDGGGRGGRFMGDRDRD